MTDISFVVICKLCKQPVDPNKLEEHIKLHPPSAHFDVIPVLKDWGKKKRGKK